MRIPNSIYRILTHYFDENNATEYLNNWFLLTLQNYTYLEDGDGILIINRHNKEIQYGHLFHNFNNNWSKMRIYYKTVRKTKSRIVEVDVESNLFLFKKNKIDNAFSIFYLLNGLENGNLKMIDPKM